MHSLTILFWTWVIGGVTFIPCLVIAIAAAIYYLSPKASQEELERHVQSKDTIKTLQEEPATILKSGWITVRRTFDPVANDGSYVNMLSSGYKSFLDSRSKDPRRARAKDEFFGTLKQTLTSHVLFLYDSDPATATQQTPVDCWAAIDVTLHECSIYPSEGVPDAELWMKKNAVKLRPRNTLPSASEVTGKTEATESADDVAEPGKPLPWYIFTKTNYDKEDWYFALLSASNTTDKSSDRTMFDPEQMVSLLESIDVQPDFLPLRWFNAMFGRLFLGVSRTAALEDYIVSRIVRKLNKVNKPSYLSEIRVREVSVGNSPPLFGKAAMKEFSPDGAVSMEMAVKFKGELRITISTVATINLGARFKPYEVALVLAIVLKELDGILMFKLKKAPSNRFWFAFTTMPKMVLNIEPVVSDRKIKWSMITKNIESRIREIILESVVSPHFDDIAFFNTLPYPHRGGIFGEAARKNEELATADPDPEGEEGDARIPEAMAGEADQQVAESGLRQRNTGEKNDEDRKSAADSDNASLRNTETGAKKSKSWFSTKQGDNPAASTSSGPIPHRVPPPFVKKSSKKEVESVDPNETAATKLAKVLQQSELAKAATAKPENRTRSPSMLSAVSASSVSLQTGTNSISTAPTDLSHLATPDQMSLIDSPGALTPPSLPSRQASMSSAISTPDSQSVDVASILPTTSKAVVPPEPPRRPAAPPTVQTPTQSPVSVKSTASSFLPPPARTSENQDSSTAASPSSLLNQWRNKTPDKQAISASVNQSVTQAKDVMKRWGANWNKPKETPAPINDSTLLSDPASELLDKPGGSSTLSRNRSSQRSSSVSLTNGLNPSPSQATTRLSMDSSALSSSAPQPKRPVKTITAALPPPANAAYRPATMMAIPAITDKARQGGIGSEGVLDIKPVKPGDEPVPAEKRRILPPTFVWNKSSEQVPTASTSNFTPNNSHKVPPPFQKSPTLQGAETKTPTKAMSEPVSMSSATQSSQGPSTLQLETASPKIAAAIESAAAVKAVPPTEDIARESSAIETAAPNQLPKVQRKPPPQLDNSAIEASSEGNSILPEAAPVTIPSIAEAETSSIKDLTPLKKSALSEETPSISEETPRTATSTVETQQEAKENTADDAAWGM